MTAVHGSLAAFDSVVEDWTEYTECLQFYFHANGISEAVKQQAVLLSYCRAQAFSDSSVLPV